MEKQHLNIAPGFGDPEKQIWQKSLQKFLEKDGISVWNDALPGDQNSKNIAEEWKNALKEKIEKNSNWVVYSASAIPFLKALLEKNVSINNIFFIASWLKDPDFQKGTLGGKVFGVGSESKLQPFVTMSEPMTDAEYEKIKSLIHGEIWIFESDNDPYIAPHQARFIQEKLDGSIVILPGRGHFEYREKNAKHPELNSAIDEVNEKVKEVLKQN